MGSRGLPSRRWGGRSVPKRNFNLSPSNLVGSRKPRARTAKAPSARMTSSLTTWEEEQGRPVPISQPPQGRCMARNLPFLLFHSELTCPCLFGDKWTTGSCRISLPLGLSRNVGSTFDTAGRWHVGSATQHRTLWCRPEQTQAQVDRWRQLATAPLSSLTSKLGILAISLLRVYTIDSMSETKWLMGKACSWWPHEQSQVPPNQRPWTTRQS